MAQVLLALCPAEDELDELALWMFQRLLDPTEYGVELLGAALLTSERLSAIEQKAPQLIVIGALPPGGLPRTPSPVPTPAGVLASSPDCRGAVGGHGGARGTAAAPGIGRRYGRHDAGGQPDTGVAVEPTLPGPGTRRRPWPISPRVAAHRSLAAPLARRWRCARSGCRMPEDVTRAR